MGIIKHNNNAVLSATRGEREDMKRIETLTPNDRLAVVRTLNAAAINGESAYICPGRCVECKDCAAEPECELEYIHEPGGIRTFIDWIMWLLDEVESPAINSGLHVFCTNVQNQYCIERDDDLNFNKIYAQGKPLTALFFDKRYIKVIDVFASRNSVACIFAKDNRSSENIIYIDKAI